MAKTSTNSPPPRPASHRVLGAIDVGTNAVRLKLARVLPDGTLETLMQERDPIRPGEGVFRTGALPRATADRLISTLRRYSALCRRHKALVRAVATSALRSSKNQTEVVRRALAQADVKLEVISGQEEARLICLGVFQHQPAHAKSVCIDIGGGSTEVVMAEGDRPANLFSMALGAVRLTERFKSAGRVSSRQADAMREYVEKIVEETLPQRLPAGCKQAFGSSGTVQAVVHYASDGMEEATADELSEAVEDLLALSPAERHRLFDARRADIIVAGAVVLDAVVRRLRIKSLRAVERGLRDGVLLSLLGEKGPHRDEEALEDSALALGARLGFDEAHARQVNDLALTLFDELAPLHQLPLSVRPFLQVAALLHDVGTSVNYERHHKHSQYIIENADLPGLSERERKLVASVARYHRRSPPELQHVGLSQMPVTDARLVRKLATLLRLANALDRSHHQPVRALKVRRRENLVHLTLKSRGPVDLELWDAELEAPLFKRVFGKALVVG